MQGRFWRSSSRTADCCVSTVTPRPLPKREARFAADPRVAIFLAPFSALAACADQVEPGLKFDGILFDLGVSSPQLDDAARGFSFMQDGPLDMRMTPGEGVSAADVVNGASEAELIRIFREFGEERLAPRIARAIVADRQVAAVRAHAAAGRDDRARRRAARERAQASGHPRVSGAAHPRQRRTRGARGRARRGARAPGAARTARGDQLSFARGSHGEAIHAPPFAGRSDVRRTCRDIPAHARPKLELVGKSVAGRTRRKPRAIRARAARGCASPNASTKESPHEIRRLAAARFCRCCGSPCSAPPCR